MENRLPDMNTVENIKQVIGRLPPQQQAELLDWLHSHLTSRSELEQTLHEAGSSAHDKRAYRDL